MLTLHWHLTSCRLRAVMSTAGYPRTTSSLPWTLKKANTSPKNRKPRFSKSKAQFCEYLEGGIRPYWSWMHSLPLPVCSPHTESSTNSQEATQQTRTGKLISARVRYLGCICWAGFIWIIFPSWLTGTSVPAHTGDAFGTGEGWDRFWQLGKIRCRSRHWRDATGGLSSPVGFAEVLETFSP